MKITNQQQPFAAMQADTSASPVTAGLNGPRITPLPTVDRDAANDFANGGWERRSSLPPMLSSKPWQPTTDHHADCRCESMTKVKSSEPKGKHLSEPPVTFLARDSLFGLARETRNDAA
ncbi:hypothetical protein QYH69_07990 [Paraburkholderia sp. SARCC-3016]|jgi:hypothetical protein|uniref:hypothetical protein n=1 Tax=Paraburkholderia sp. SARCC-3016 TaxID=3058611 RepID=UPI002807A9F4|nr:hypothetical protein [Paraburkholderia sp. SARCC-3016]MDQ7977187.1 hypothetical protein [Paraburkholderia sp. SARCC-3016]